VLSDVLSDNGADDLSMHVADAVSFHAIVDAVGVDAMTWLLRFATCVQCALCLDACL
jgi:NAD-dependent dihydropyrimidine dehydrogenase PreA subunit